MFAKHPMSEKLTNLRKSEPVFSLPVPMCLVLMLLICFGEYHSSTFCFVGAIKELPLK
jgi:hypothetical protein